MRHVANIKQLGCNDNKQESFYHGFMIGLTAALSESCELKSNRESGGGRYDVMIIPHDIERHAIILEFKAIDAEEEKLTQAAQEAFSKSTNTNIRKNLSNEIEKIF